MSVPFSKKNKAQPAPALAALAQVASEAPTLAQAPALAALAQVASAALIGSHASPVAQQQPLFPTQAPQQQMVIFLEKVRSVQDFAA